MQITDKELKSKYGISIPKGKYEIDVVNGKYMVYSIKDDTEGCILVGENKMKGMVLGSNLKFHELMDSHLIPAKERGERIYIEIR